MAHSVLIHAQVIAAEGEMNASRALKEASLVIAESPSALQLRYLQTLNTIAAEKNSTIIFPLPMDVISHFMRKWGRRLDDASACCSSRSLNQTTGLHMCA